MSEEHTETSGLFIVFVLVALYIVLPNFAAFFPSSCNWALVRVGWPEQCKLNAIREMKK